MGGRRKLGAQSTGGGGWGWLVGEVQEADERDGATNRNQAERPGLDPDSSGVRPQERCYYSGGIRQGFGGVTRRFPRMRRGLAFQEGGQSARRRGSEKGMGATASGR